jgi:hypothetical protein
MRLSNSAIRFEGHFLTGALVGQMSPLSLHVSVFVEICPLMGAHCLL